MNYEITVYNLVKNITDRVYLGAAPHNPTLPFLLVQLVSAEHEHVLGGAGGLIRATMQFDAIGRDQQIVMQIISDVRSLLDGYSDNDVLYASSLDESDQSLPPNNDSPEFLYRRVSRFLIRIRD